MLQNLSPKNGEVYIDATFGAGGYSAAILETADCKVYAIDRDETTKKFAIDLEKKFPRNFHILKGNFSEMEKLLALENIESVDGIVFDFGVSSMQFDEHERGFSFASNAILDMRMDTSQSLTAHSVVNELDQKELEEIIRNFGEEKKAKLIAKKIVNARRASEINTCEDLAKIVRSCFFGYFKVDPATKTFQAIRIFVNQELDEIRLALASAKKILKKNGRLIAVSFHSLEDSIVKNFLKGDRKQAVSRYLPELDTNNQKENSFILSQPVVVPSKTELTKNNRARSAKMRVAVKK
jgi:16S rRNA (cytosine1402-N4)-methyltransferase